MYKDLTDEELIDSIEITKRKIVNIWRGLV